MVSKTMLHVVRCRTCSCATRRRWFRPAALMRCMSSSTWTSWRLQDLEAWVPGTEYGEMLGQCL